MHTHVEMFPVAVRAGVYAWVGGRGAFNSHGPSLDVFDLDVCVCVSSIEQSCLIEKSELYMKDEMLKRVISSECIINLTWVRPDLLWD